MSQREDEYAGQQGVYDALHSLSKNHAKETERLLKRVRGAIGRDPVSWLDVACGTGHHLEALQAAGIARLAGLDNSPAQLQGAQQRLAGTGIELELADMRDFSFNGQKRFDVVSCLFSSVGHLHHDADYLKALKRMAAHLNPKGVVVVEPWIDAADFVPGRVDAETFQHSSGQIVRITKHLTSPEVDFCELEFRFIHSQAGNPVIQDWTTSFKLKLRSVADQLAMFEQVFGSVEFQQTGSGSRGTFVARKPKSLTA